MERDATNAGVALGGLVSTDEIRILICYILDSIKEPVPYQKLSELLHYEGIANYFEVGNAFASLSDNGHIVADENDSECYVITESGSRIASTLKTSVPLTIREKTYALTVKMLSKIKYAKESKIDITPIDKGYNIRCAVVEGDIELMSVSLFVADKDQALNIKELFLDDPTLIYSGIIELLTKTKLK